MDNNIKVIWFDLDDTLIDFHANSRTALAMTYDRFGLAEAFATPQEWIEVYERHNRDLWDLYSRGEVTKPYLRRQRFIRPLTIEGRMAPARVEGMVAQLDTYYLDSMAAQDKTVDGAREVLEQLRGHGYTIGILSNGFKQVQYRKLASARLDRLIDIVVLSDDIDVNKPDRRIFEYAMERAGSADAPSANLMVGDNPATDIAGALGAGWRAVLFDPDAAKRGAVDPRAEVISTLPSLLEML